MANVTYDEYTDWRICPVDSIKLYIADYYHEFKNIIDDGTEYTIEPILSIGRDADGNQRVVGLKFSGTFNILENNLEEISTTLDGLIAIEGLQKLVLTLKASTAQRGGGQIIIEIDTVNADYYNWWGTFKVVKGEAWPELIFTTEGRFSIDVLTTTTKLFEQNW